MKQIKKILDKYKIKANKYIIINNVTIIESKENKYVVKKNNNNKIYLYLNTRNFNYYPKILHIDEYNIYEYINQVEIPKEQKIIDLIELVALLHSKTTFYKEIDKDEYKKIYEDINNNILYLRDFYTKLITKAEQQIYMSPSNYFLSLNISKIFGSLNYCKDKIDKWYKIINIKQKQRQTVIHNNLRLEHFIENEMPYLISWDKSKIDNPIFDLYKLYKRHWKEFDFEYILKKYEKIYPLLEEEKLLFITLISLPDLIEEKENEFEKCIEIGKIIDYLEKTERLISPYNSKKTKQNNEQKQK